MAKSKRKIRSQVVRKDGQVFVEDKRGKLMLAKEATIDGEKVIYIIDKYEPPHKTPIKTYNDTYYEKREKEILSKNRKRKEVRDNSR